MLKRGVGIFECCICITDGFTSFFHPPLYLATLYGRTQVGHLKTVIILTGGCLFFGDSMPLKKLFGVCIAMIGIVW